MNPLYLDTDIGDDIDDALALTIALSSPEIDLRGVTTVFRDAPRRALLARQVLELTGHGDVPVFAGCSLPLLQTWDGIPGGATLGRQFEALDPDLVLPAGPSAVEALRAAVLDCAARGETLTIAPIGPLTNIALLFHLAPEVIPLCRVVLMGGDWNMTRAEWNIMCDPEAAAMVFRSGVDLTMVGLDVTLKCQLNAGHVQQFRDADKPHTTLLANLIELWGHVVTLHDPLTLLTLFDDCVQFEPMRLEVPLCGERRAFTVPTDGEPNCMAAVGVDADRAVRLFMERALA